MDEAATVNLREQYLFLGELSHAFSNRDRDWQKYGDYDGSYGEMADKLDKVRSTISDLMADEQEG